MNIHIQFTCPPNDEEIAAELAEMNTESTDIWAQVDAECSRSVVNSHDSMRIHYSSNERDGWDMINSDKVYVQQRVLQ